MKANLIVEGANCSGKGKAVKLLKKKYSGSTIIEFHDYYYHHLKSQLKISDFYSEEHWKNIPKNQKAELDKYLDSRFNASINFARDNAHNLVIFERLLLTRVVYNQILFGIENSNYLKEKDELLAKHNFFLILMTAPNQEVLRKKIIEKNKRRPRRNNIKAQYHLKNVEIGLKKDELYKSYFNKMNYTKKIMIEFDSDLNDLEDKLVKAISNFEK